MPQWAFFMAQLAIMNGSRLVHTTDRLLPWRLELTDEIQDNVGKGCCTMNTRRSRLVGEQASVCHVENPCGSRDKPLLSHGTPRQTGLRDPG